MQRPIYFTPPEKVTGAGRTRAVAPTPGGGVGASTGTKTGDTPGPAPIVPPAQPAPTPLQLRSRTFRANTEPLMPVWGPVKGLGGQLWVEEPLADGGFLCMWAINYGPTSAISNIRFDTGTFATYGMAQGTHWNQYLGTPTQIMDPIAAAALGTAWTNLPYPAFANIVVAPFATVTAALSATGSQTVTPSSMADIRVGDVISVQNADGTHFERVTVTAVTATTFTATFASTKAANWQLVITTNISYVVAHFPAAQPGQPQPNFESFRCDHDGLLVYDPVQDATVTTKFFVAEPVLAHADYWTSKVYGKGEPVSSIDWTGSVAATTALQRANIGGGTKRYQVGLKLPGKASHDQNSDIIRSHGQGLTPVFNSGLWQFWMDWTQSPSGIVLTDSGPNANILNKPAWRFSGRQSRPTRTRVSYPNPNGIAKTEVTPPNDDPLLASGLVELVEKTWNLDGSPSDDQSQRLARYFRKSSAIDREATIRVTNDGVQILPYIIVNVTSQRLHCVNAPCVVLNVANADPSSGQSSAWDVTVQPYDAAVHDDTLGSVTSTTPAAYSSPDSPPPTPAAPTLTQVGFDVTVGFVPVATYPFYLQQLITVQETTAAGAVLPVYTLGETATGPLTIRKVNMGSTYTVKAYVRNFSMLLSLVAATATITPAMATPPEVVNMTVLGTNATNSRVFWDQPATIVESQYGAAFWSASNVGSFTASRVNDGLTALAAFDWSPAADTTITYDAGVGNVKDFRYLIETADGGTGNALQNAIIEYSDNGSAWTAAVTPGLGAPFRASQTNPAGTASGGLYPRPPIVAGKYVMKRGWQPSGAHRFWRARKGNSGAMVGYITYELQWGEATAINTAITHYVINDNLAGRLYTTIMADAIPTSLNPLLLSTITTTSFTPANNTTVVSFNVGVIACINEDHSAGVSGSPGTFTFSAPAIAVLTLANGLNSDIDVTNFVTAVNGHSLADITGPSAAFSVGGFTPVYPNKTLTVVNRTGQLMTVVNEDASSTAANRITTQTGADVILASPASAQFVYDGVATRWLLTSMPLTKSGSTFDLRAPSTGADLFMAFGVDPASGPSFNFGYSGSSFGRSSAFWNLRPDASAVAPNPSYRWLLQNVTKLMLDYHGRLVTFGDAPTAATQGTGWGTGATVRNPSLDGCSDLGGTITVTAGTSPGNIVATKVTFSAALGTNEPTVIVVPRDGTGLWDNAAVVKLTGCSTTDFTVQISNNGVNLTAGSTYKFKYIVLGN